MQGFIYLHRQLTDNGIWQDKPFNKGAAWVDLLFRASFKDTTFLLGNTDIELKRGEFVTSILKLSFDWGWSEKKVSNYLLYLEARQMIGQKRNNKYTLVSISKYDTYQNIDNIKEEVKKTKRRCKEDVKQTINNGNTDNTVNNDNSKELSHAEKIENSIKQKKVEFKTMVDRYIENKPNKFSPELIQSFLFHWGEANLKTGKLKWELPETFEISGRLRTFVINDNKKKQNNLF